MRKVFPQDISLQLTGCRSFGYKVIQDQNGYMWFCTDKGIARYNGYEFKTFTTADGLPSNEIWDAMEDS